MSEETETVYEERPAQPDAAASPETGGKTRDVESGSESIVALERRRRQRLRYKIVLVCMVTIIVIGLGYRFTSTMMTPAESIEPEIPPMVQFEAECAAFAKEAGRSTLHIQDIEVTDDMIAAIEPLESLETLILDQGAVTDASMDLIAAMPNLRQLRLRLSPIGDEGMKRLASCETLWFVNLPHAACTSAGVAELARLPKLRQLRLGAPELGNETAREIAKIKTLRTVHLIGVPITDEGIKTIAGLPLLESLYLDDSAVTEAGWQWLFENRSNLHIHINQDHHDRDPQKHSHRE